MRKGMAPDDVYLDECCHNNILSPILTVSIVIYTEWLRACWRLDGHHTKARLVGSFIDSPRAALQAPQRLSLGARAATAQTVTATQYPNATEYLHQHTQSTPHTWHDATSPRLQHPIENIVHLYRA